jgi:glutaredoxin
MNKELIVFGRTYSCPDLMRTQRFLKTNNIEYRQVNIDEDETALEIIEQWVGHHSVPTVVVANAGDVHPIVEPAPLPSGRSARSFDRGSMITEPSDEALRGFLRRHGLAS